MTIKQRSLLKLRNALRAYHGAKYRSGKWAIPPQPMASERIGRWLFRCQQRGYITAMQAARIRSKLTGSDLTDAPVGGALASGSS